MSIIVVKLTEDLLTRLDAYAMKHGLSRSEVIRKALECYLEGICVKREWRI